MLRKLTYRLGRRTLWVVTALALALAVTVTTIRLDTTYTVKVVTEIMALRVIDLDLWSPWNITDALIFQDDSPDGQPVSGSLYLASGAEVTVERISHGPMRLLLTAPSDESAGQLYDQSTEESSRLQSYVVIELSASDLAENVRSGQSTVFPFAGDARVGAANPDPAILRSGTVTMLGHSIVGRTLYEAQTVELDPGDHFSVQATSSAGFGQIVVNEGPALTVVFHAVGRQGIVSRFGTTGYEVSTSLLDRILNDRAIQGIWVAFLFFMVTARRVGLRKED